MTQHEPLTLEDAAPCMDCGSVQCAFCSTKVLSALQGLKEEQRQMFECKDDYDDLEGFLSDLSRLPDKWFPIANSQSQRSQQNGTDARQAGGNTPNSREPTHLFCDVKIGQEGGKPSNNSDGLELDEQFIIDRWKEVIATAENGAGLMKGVLKE